MAKVFLTGAKGQLGSEIEFALLKQGHIIVSTNHQTLDISKEDRVLSAILESKAQVVINTAAYTNVEKAEIERPQAYNVNALGARNLAQACSIAHIPIIHISTDYVFGVGKGPFNENSETKPECVYAHSKLEGENYIARMCKEHIIIRTSWLFGRMGRNFVKIMLSLAKDRSDMAVVSDQLGNPTPAEPLAIFITHLVDKIIAKDFKHYGIYHYCGYPDTSWDEFARLIFDKALKLKALNHRVNVVSIKSDDFSSKAKRPLDSRLECSKLENTFELKMPCWHDYIDEVIKAYLREIKGLSPIEGYDNNISYKS